MTHFLVDQSQVISHIIFKMNYNGKDPSNNSNCIKNKVDTFFIFFDIIIN